MSHTNAANLQWQRGYDRTQLNKNTLFTYDSMHSSRRSNCVRHILLYLQCARRVVFDVGDAHHLIEHVVRYDRLDQLSQILWWNNEWNAAVSRHTQHTDTAQTIVDYLFQDVCQCMRILFDERREIKLAVDKHRAQSISQRLHLFRCFFSPF